MSFAARGLTGRLPAQATAQIRGFAKAPPGDPGLGHPLLDDKP